MGVLIDNKGLDCFVFLHFLHLFRRSSIETMSAEEISQTENTRRFHGKCRGRLAKLHFNKVAIQTCEMGSQLKLSNLSIPPGFNEILTGLSREVMREQPDDISAFAALYFEEELNKGVKSRYPRQNTKVLIQDVGAMQTTEGSQTEEKVNGVTQTGSLNGQDGATQTQDEQEQDSDHLICRRVSSRFRFSICNNDEAARAASIIQSSYREHRRRASMVCDQSQNKISDSDITRRQSMPADMKRPSISGQESENELNNTIFSKQGFDSSMHDIAEPDAEKAATTIQAAFRGHCTRQSIAAGSHPSLHKVEPQEETVQEESEEPHEDTVKEEPHDDTVKEEPHDDAETVDDAPAAADAEE